MTEKSLVQLKDTLLFEGLTDAEMTRVSRTLYRRAFPMNAMILTEGQPGEVVYILLSGTVKVFTSKADGSEVIISIMGPGDTVGEMSMMDSVGRSASVVTLEDSEIAWMSRVDFQRSLEEIPKISLNLNRILTARLRFNTDLIQSYAAFDVNGRIASHLLAFAEKYGQEQDGVSSIPIRLPQTEIAGLVGASRKRVNQVMVAFKRQGLVEVDSDHRITILDKEGLRAYCQ